MIIPLLDVAFLVLNIVVAFLNRGTIWGWLATAIVIWHISVIIKFINQN